MESLDYYAAGIAKEAQRLKDLTYMGSGDIADATREGVDEDAWERNFDPETGEPTTDAARSFDRAVDAAQTALDELLKCLPAAVAFQDALEWLEKAEAALSLPA